MFLDTYIITLKITTGYNSENFHLLLLMCYFIIKNNIFGGHLIGYIQILQILCAVYTLSK